MLSEFHGTKLAWRISPRATESRIPLSADTRKVRSRVRKILCGPSYYKGAFIAECLCLICLRYLKYFNSPMQGCHAGLEACSIRWLRITISSVMTQGRKLPAQQFGQSGVMNRSSMLVHNLISVLYSLVSLQVFATTWQSQRRMQDIVT